MSSASFWRVKVSVDYTEHFKWMTVEDKCESKELIIYFDYDKRKAKEIYCGVVEYLKSKYKVKESPNG